MVNQAKPAGKGWSNGAIAAACLSFFAGMVGMSYASVPLYKIFCQMTGYGGTTQRVEQVSEVILDKTLKVRFDSNVAGGLPWEFAPVEREITLRIGETREIAYTAHNPFNVPTRGRATFNVTPEYAGSYFNKIACFCFTDTELKPGETLRMPVQFYIDPDIVNQRELKDLTTITLSYTFFPVADDKPVALAPAAGQTSTQAITKTGG